MPRFVVLFCSEEWHGSLSLKKRGKKISVGVSLSWGIPLQWHLGVPHQHSRRHPISLRWHIKLFQKSWRFFYSFFSCEGRGGPYWWHESQASPSFIPWVNSGFDFGSNGGAIWQWYTNKVCNFIELFFFFFESMNTGNADQGRERGVDKCIR